MAHPFLLLADRDQRVLGVLGAFVAISATNFLLAGLASLIHIIELLNRVAILTLVLGFLPFGRLRGLRSRWRRNDG
jgi:hypothetical protein